MKHLSYPFPTSERKLSASNNGIPECISRWVGQLLHFPHYEVLAPSVRAIGGKNGIAKAENRNIQPEELQMDTCWPFFFGQRGLYVCTFSAAISALALDSSRSNRSTSSASLASPDSMSAPHAARRSTAFLHASRSLPERPLTNRRPPASSTSLGWP